MPANPITQKVDAILAAKQAAGIEAVVLAEAQLVDHLLQITGVALLQQLATPHAPAVLEIATAGRVRTGTLTHAQVQHVLEQWALAPSVSLAPPSEARRARLQGQWPCQEDALIAVMTARTPPQVGDHLTLFLQLLPSESLLDQSQAA